ncbi:protein Wnt [Trichonephila clavipes]|nr:protein Wnt [Trichonephila clavipes]
MVGVSVTPPDMASEQVSLCSAVPGLVVQQQRVCHAHPAVIRAVSGGARRGIEECQNQFRHDRWNCTVEGGESVFDHTLQRAVVSDFNPVSDFTLKSLPAYLRVCQVIYSQFGLAIHQNDHQARRRFVEWAQNEIAVVPNFHKRILFSDEVHFWLNGYVNKQNCRIWSEANPQVYVETPLHPEKLTVRCALWAGGILLQKR